MKFINYLSELTSIDAKYLILITKTLVLFLILNIIKQAILTIIKHLHLDEKSEYEYSHHLKWIITICKIILFLLLWSKYLSSILTLISLLSAAFTIALRDIIFNFFCGIYIKVVKPFEIEDRIEINNYKGDVININALNFEVLEVNNEDFTGQSTGVITSIPNSLVFSNPLRNYNKGFKYIWNEIKVPVPIDFDITKAHATLYRIINNNDIIKPIPDKLRKQIDNITTEYRIYFNNYSPIIYMKFEENYVNYTIRYLVHPKKARYVNSCLWKHILLAYQNGEIILYNKDYVNKEIKPKEETTEELTKSTVKKQHKSFQKA